MKENELSVAHNYNYDLLKAGIIAQAARDYEAAMKKIIKLKKQRNDKKISYIEKIKINEKIKMNSLIIEEVEKFMCSGWCYELCDADGFVILEAIDQAIDDCRRIKYTFY